MTAEPSTSRGPWRDHVPGSFAVPLRATVEEHVAPVATAIDAEDRYPTAAVKALARDGYTSLLLPEEHGGQGETYDRAAAVFESVSYASAAVGISLITIFQAQKIIQLFGSESLQHDVLPRFRHGLITSYALTEANHGSDIRHLDTKAVDTGSGWEINGRKSFITSGSAAEAFVILAEADAGVSAFYVAADLPGVSTEVTTNAATFGLRNGPHVDLVLDSVVVPRNALIGTPGKGVRQAVTTLNHSRVLAAAISTGIACAAFDGAYDFATNRHAFDQRVSEFQGIQWYFAEMATHIDAARLLTYDAARALTAGGGVARISSEAKLFASRVATEVASLAVQVCGAYGVMESAPFGRYLRDAKAYEIAGGSSEILKNTIAKDLAGGFAPRA